MVEIEELLDYFRVLNLDWVEIKDGLIIIYDIANSDRDGVFKICFLDEDIKICFMPKNDVVDDVKVTYAYFYRYVIHYIVEKNMYRLYNLFS